MAAASEPTITVTLTPWQAWALWRLAQGEAQRLERSVLFLATGVQMVAAELRAADSALWVAGVQAMGDNGPPWPGSPTDG